MLGLMILVIPPLASEQLGINIMLWLSMIKVDQVAGILMIRFHFSRSMNLIFVIQSLMVFKVKITTLF